MKSIKNNEGRWIEGLSWTPGNWEVTANPDGTAEKIYVHGGPFYFNPRLFGKIYIYWGFRPTAPWTRGGNEGIFPFVKRIFQRLNCSNLALLPTVRRAK